jgi:hypothetical protein
MAAMDGEVIYLSPTYSGSVHDKKICNLEILTFSKKLQVFVDLGFLGLTSSTAQIVIPHKHKKNQQLSSEQEHYNKWVAKIRVRIEHTIASIKIFRKVKEKFRGRLFAREDTVMLVACGLHNLKLKIKQNQL